MSESVTVIDIIASVTDETEPGVRSATQNVSKFEQTMQKVQKQIDGMKGKSKFDVVMGLKDMATKGIQATITKIKSIAGKMWTFTLGVVDKVTAPLRGIMNAVFSLQGAILGASGAFAGLIVPTKLAMDLEQNQIALETMLGSAQKASALTDKIQTFAAETPFETKGLMDSTKTLLNFGVAEEEVMGIMKQLGDISLGDEERFKSLSLVFGQVSSLGRLQGQDLLQLINAGWNPLNEISKRTGESMSVLKKRMEDGAIGLDEVRLAMSDATSEGGLFFKAMEKQSKSMKGLLGTLKDALDNKILTRWGQGLSAGVKPMLEKVSVWFDVNADVVNGWGDALFSMGEKVSIFVANKVTDIMESVKSMTQSPEWKNAEGLFGKIKVAWDKITPWVAEKMASVGKGIGTALKTGILGLLGVDTGNVIGEGASIGKAFAEGFLEGFDPKKVASGIWQAFKGIFKDAATILPGGAETSNTAPLSAALVGYTALKTAKTGHSIYKGGKAVVNGTKGVFNAIRGVTGAGQAAAAAGEVGATGLFGGMRTGAQIFKAANAPGAGAAAQSAATFAKAGQLGKGVQAGAKLASGGAKAASMGAKAIPLIGGLISLVEMGFDAKEGTERAAEWTGSDSLGNKIASGAGAFLGGTGDGVMGKKSGLGKAMDIGGGALKGAGIGAAIGSIIPGVGTAIGAAVGAGVGALTSAIGGENIAKFFSKAGKTIGDFFTGPFVDFFKGLWSAVSNFFTQTIPNAVSNVGNAIKTFFTETIPQKWSELWTGVGNFFTQTIPYALGFIVGKAQIFFTETVPQFFGNLWDGVVNFFTVTIPNTLSAIGSALTTFFTETVPTFFSNVWSGIVGFFTETIPAALTAIGEALTVFFTETVPNFFINVWEGITTFFTETIPNTLTSVGDALKTFFTETIPNFFKNLWEGVTGFFTETIPGVIEDVKSGISNFFTGIKKKITGFFSGIWDGITSFFGGAADSFSAGYSDATKHASGGIMTSPHVGLVAEDGAEAIIPLSGKRRERGLALWEQTGELLGVKPYAEGGIAGDAPVVNAPMGGYSDATKHASGGINVPVTIENVTFEIRIDGGEAPDTESLVEIIKENVRNLTDEIAYRLALSLQQTFANTPLAAWS
ncbi:hypothetical protein FACS1894111_10290 [Clostridia bacterium]|nr:hypothetical protein FACS1894111_10290 [Clostridia bacterium]